MPIYIISCWGSYSLLSTAIPYFCVIFFQRSPTHTNAQQMRARTQFGVFLLCWFACLLAISQCTRDMHLFFHSAYSVSEEQAIEQQAEGNSKRFMQSSTTSKITKLKLDGIRDEHKRYKCSYLYVFVCICRATRERERTSATDDDNDSSSSNSSDGRDEAKKTFNEQQNLIKVIKLVFKCTLHLAFYMCT